MKKDPQEILIDRYSKKGHGLGEILETQSRAEVVGAAVGDRVLVQLLKKSKRTYRTTFLEILEPSEKRTTPKCRHFGQCGGCTWQMLTPEEQNRLKMERVQELFPGQHISKIISAEPTWGYRNKMEYSFSQNREGDKFLGLIIARSRGHVLNLEECPISPPWFAETLKSVRSWWRESNLEAYFGPKDRGSLRTLTLRQGHHTQEMMAVLTVSGNPDYRLTQEQIAAFKRAIPGENPSIFLRIQQIHKGKPTQFFEMHLAGEDHIREKIRLRDQTYTFKISPSSFFQPNTYQAERLYQTVLDMAAPQKEDLFYDLYCGTGTLGLIFAPHVKRVVGIELNPYATFDATVNMEANGIKNMMVHRGDVGKVLETLSDRPDLALLDPPRAGLDQKALDQLTLLNPKKILYISCNPETQAENCQFLAELGYKIEAIQPVDQFPHTPHIENIVLLKLDFQ